jgi:hypothetical protein
LFVKRFLRFFRKKYILTYEVGKWYSGGELYDFRSDGKLYIMGSDMYGVIYTVSGNIITTYVSGSQTGTATFSISGSGTTARLTITAPATSDFTRLVSGTYTRSGA